MRKSNGRIQDVSCMYEELLGIDGEAIELEWTNFPEFSSISILREIQQDLETKNIQPEDVKDRIIFMSMFNDIEWKTNDENCISNAVKTKNYAMRFLQGHWTFLGPQSEEKWCGDSHDPQGHRNCTASKMVHRFKETGFKSTSALSRGILKRKKGEETIHFNGDSSNAELLFQTVHSVNQLQYSRSRGELV